MKQLKNILAIFMLLCLATPVARAQNLESIGDEKPLRVSGGLSASQIFYAASGMDNRRDPYSYFLSGNLNFDLYGWSMPLNFTFSNQSLSYQQPFNQYGLHPTYKWATAHIGYSSMNFSPYTLSGHIFKGVGLELRPPGRFSYSLMYGRLQRAVQADTLSEHATEASAFRRMGYGFKLGYQHEGDYADLILFRAKDELNSLAFIPEMEELMPAENLVMSLSAGKTFFGRLLLSAELAGSAFTRDIRSPLSPGRSPYSWTGPIYTSRSSSNYYKAFKSALSYRGDFYTVGLGYERIDPEYQTLGAYYFNNDLENMTINTTTALMHGKVNLGMNIGLQRNNLDKEKISSMSRMVGSANISYTASERLNMNATYSNFQSFTNVRPQFEQLTQLTPYDNLDTLNFTQMSQSANLSGNYVLSTDKEHRRNLSANLSFQHAADKQSTGSTHAGTQFYNFNAAYSSSLAPQQMTMTGALNYSHNQMDTIASIAIGPTAALSRAFFDKKLRSTMSFTVNNSYHDKQLQSRIFSLRTGGRYTLRKKHHLNLNMVGLHRRSKRAEGMLSFMEFTGTLGYSLNF